METADFLKKLAEKLDIPLIFKSSYDKANRTSINSFRGPGIKEGLRILGKIKEELGIPVLSDVHRFSEIEAAERILDVIQIPAFLCRQTDFILEVARTGKPVNIKKGQFLAPWDISQVIEKVLSTGCARSLSPKEGPCSDITTWWWISEGFKLCNRPDGRLFLTPLTAYRFQEEKELAQEATVNMRRYWQKLRWRQAQMPFSWKFTKIRTTPFVTVLIL
jgi:hypothetical protein